MKNLYKLRTMKEDAISASPTDQQWDLGPDLKPLGWREHLEISKHILKHHGFKIVIMISAIVGLVIALNAWTELYPPIYFQNATTVTAVSPSNWAGWLSNLQSYLAVGTFLVALFVWYGEIRNDWQNELPKRMSVFFFHNGKPVIVCRYVWLAGAEDLRAWGQQVAAQAVENDRKLKFGPDVKTQIPNLVVGPDSTVCRHYAVRFRLKELPSLLKDSAGCRYQNFEAADKDVHTIPLEQAEALQVVADWQEPAEGSSDGTRRIAGHDSRWH